jgi:hypothetical protein
MSDAGKVMIGTDGNPLLSADGKIVLADDLYPFIPNHTIARFERNIVFADAVCPASEIWSKAWITATGSFGGYLDVRDATHGFCTQGVSQITIGTNAIDWARVKSIKVQVDWAWFTGIKKAGWDCKVTTAMNTGSLPADTTIRDSWALAKTVTSDDANGTFYVEFAIDGVEPTSLEMAFFIDISTCGDTGEAYLVLTNQYYGPHIIYNLATA